MLGSSTKTGEPTVMFASKNIAMVSRPLRFGSSVGPPCCVTFAELDKLKCDHLVIKDIL